MSEILTQDSISLTESLDGVRFGYLATSSRKVVTSRWSNKHPAHWNTTKGSTPFALGKTDTAEAYGRSLSSEVYGQIQHYVTGHWTL